MKKIVTRLLLFFTVFPALVILIVFLPQYKHLALNLLAVIASAIGSIEAVNIFRNKDWKLSAPLTFCMGMLLPLTAYASLIGLLPSYALLAAVALGLSVIIVIPTSFAVEKDFPFILQKVTVGVLAYLYPGFFVAFVVLISGFESASVLLAIFVISVFLNDALAYAFGMLFGKNNRNIVPVSPNKSMNGFIAGYLASPGVFLVGYILYPGLFDWNIWKALVIGLVMGFTTIFGDLLESALKRSAGIKDSGNIIPGRGGILDSIDSVIFSAPFFYYLYSILV